MIRKALILTYGVVVYLLFFPTFMYMFGFMSGLFVPRTIDDGQPGPLWQALLINTGLVFLFGLQHAVMARPGFKRWWTTIVAKPIERSTFVLVSTALLALLMWQWRPMPSVIWHVEAPIVRGVIFGVFLAGVLITLLSSFLIDHFDLFGLRQVVLHFRGRDYTQRPFVLRSLYKLVRHPLMLGFIITFWAAPTMTAGHLLFSLLMTGYILIGIQMEERDLLRQHGASYERYRRRTPMLVPIPKGAQRAAVEAPAS
jgi:protein-S-isoprenylcysteine O-methyltransferase Ste14